MSESDDRQAKGRALTAKLFAGAQRAASAMPAKLQEYTTGHLFGDLWQGEELTLAERELITCTTLVALYRINEQRVHFVGAKNAGVPRSKIEAMITHVAHYAGWPCGATASGIKVSSGGRELLVLDGAPNHRCRDLAIPRSRANKRARGHDGHGPCIGICGQ